MEQKYSGSLNLLIKRNVLICNKQMKQLIDLFENENLLNNFIEEFLKEKEYFLRNIQQYIDNNKKIECLRHIKLPDLIYCFKYKKNKKNIRCIFFVYGERIVILDIFYEREKSSYRKAIERAENEYKRIKEGE